MISRIRLETGFGDSLKALFPFVSNPQEKFSSALKSFLGCEDILLFASGRAAIYFLLKALPQKKVFIPAYTCAVVKEAVLLAGKQCVEADINLETFSFRAEELEKVISSDSIVLATHQFGIKCDINAIKKLCEKHNCILLEDSAASFGTKIGAKYAGTFGSASILSFDYTKTLTCARGGAIIFNDKKLLEAVKKILPEEKNFGTLKRFLYASSYNFLASPFVYSVFTLPLVSRNSLFADNGQIEKRLTAEYAFGISNFQARLGLLQFSRLKRTIEKRKKLAEFFFEHVSKIENINIPEKRALEDSVLIRFPIIVPFANKLAFYWACREKGLDLGFSFSYSLAEEKKAPNAFIAAQKVLDLPFYSSLSKKEMKKIVEIVKEVSSQEALDLVALATNNPKKQNVSFLLGEKRGNETVAVAGIVKRLGFPFFFLAVKPEMQGKGIGSALMEKFLEKLPSKYSFLLISTDNKIAEHIYTESGFRKFGKKGKRVFLVFERKKTFFSRLAVFFTGLSLKKKG